MICTTPGRRRRDLVVERRGDVVLCQPLDSTLRLAVRGSDEDDLLAVGDPCADVGECGGGVAAIGSGGLHLDRPRPLVNVKAERGDREPRVAEPERLEPYVVERAERSRTEVDRRFTTAGGCSPRRLQELLAGRDKVSSPGTDALRIAAAGSPTSPAGDRRGAPSHPSARESATPYLRPRGPRPAW